MGKWTHTGQRGVHIDQEEQEEYEQCPGSFHIAQEEKEQC
jgi:hypothetical protein